MLSMNLLWIRSAPGDVDEQLDERRIREYLDGPGGISETADSLSDKLGINSGRCRRILDRMAEQGVVKRQDFKDIEPIYSRFPSRGDVTP
jgi:hypothetical protein